MKKNKIIYYVATGLFTLLMLLSVGMYVFNNEEIVAGFTSFGYPTYIIYPLAIAKILGLIALWFFQKKTIVEWAYAGFFFNAILASASHFNANHDIGLSYFVIPFILVSYFLGKKVRGNVINN